MAEHCCVPELKWSFNKTLVTPPSNWTFTWYMLSPANASSLLLFPPLIEKLIAYQREFHALKERLRVAEHRTLQRSSELNNILEQFRKAIAETNSSKDALTNFSGS